MTADPSRPNENDLPAVPTNSNTDSQVNGDQPTLSTNFVDDGLTDSERATVTLGPAGTIPTSIAPGFGSKPTTPMQAGISGSATSRQLPEIIAGYRRLRVLGAGGMAQVFEAEHTTLGRRVALKLLKPNVADSPDFSMRFIRESHAMAQVAHTNVVAIYDAGECGGLLYMALELVSGGDLYKLLKRRGRIALDDALGFMIGCAKGLEAIHTAGLVHRDIKPANIFLDKDGIPKIGDLGLARAADGDDRMTMTGCSWGTPSYMSPEQIKGVADLDIRADIYSLGATLYTLLVGAEPYVGETSYVITTKVLTEAAPDPREHDKTIPASVVAIIKKAMAKNRDERYLTPADFRIDLERARGGQRLIHTSEKVAPAPQAVAPTRSSQADVAAALLAGAKSTTAKSSRPSVGMDPLVMKVIAMLVVGGVLGGVYYSMQGTNLTVHESITSPSGGGTNWATITGVDDNGRSAQTVINGVNVEMRFIPAGFFTMGSPTHEVGRQPTETQHQVTLTKSFWMSRTEVTQALYKAVMSENPSTTLGDTHPVEGVSWYEARTFCEKLRAMDIPARLPTEAEWEYACRAGSASAMSRPTAPNSQGWMAPPELAAIWRDTPVDRAEDAAMRWIGIHSAEVGVQPVNLLGVNAFGLADMHGNVLEWCRDAWDGSTPYNSKPVTDPESVEGNMSIVRGGCWYYPPERCRSASREALLANSALNYVGFRFVIEDKPSP